MTSLLIPLLGLLSLGAFAQAVTERDAFVEHEALAAPAAVRLVHLFQIFQDAALEVIDLGKAAREQMRAGLLAADAAGAEHRDPAMLFGIEMPRGEIPELPEARDVRIKRAFEAAHRHLEGIAGVEHERVGRRDQRVPIGRLDIDADLPSRIGAGVAERDDL